MKYILDSRYKKLHALCVHTNTILNTCKRGRSVDFSISLRALQDELQDLEALKSPPFSKDQIEQTEEIEKIANDFLLLPENLEEVGQSLLEKSELLLVEIDPFTYSLEDSLGVRKSQVVELTKELQIYLQAHVLNLEGKASSIIDEKLIVEDITNDIRRIEKKQLKNEEKNILEKLFKSNATYQSNTSLDSARGYLQVALDAEHLFRGAKTPYKTLTELIKYLLKVYQEADKLMTSEKESFSSFTTLLRQPLFAAGVNRLKSLKLNSKDLISSRENLLFAYENGGLENGETFISRCRAIDFYKLLGHELDDFDDLLSERPDKDLKLI